jgi:hypothetical protein
VTAICCTWQVLDLHAVTAVERHKAAEWAAGGSDIGRRTTVAFGCRVPRADLQPAATRAPERSLIERELEKVGGARWPPQWAAKWAGTPI